MAEDAASPGEWFARRLEEIRTRKGWSQTKLADRLAEMGNPVHQTAIAKIENGERRVTLDEAFRIAAALGVSPLSLCLPPDDDEPIKLAERFITAARWVRRSVQGLGPIPAVYDADGIALRTADGQPLEAGELDELRRFHQQWLSRQQVAAFERPGVWLLQAGATEYSDAAARADQEAMFRALDTIGREVDRQRDALTTEADNGAR